MSVCDLQMSVSAVFRFELNGCVKHRMTDSISPLTVKESRLLSPEKAILPSTHNIMACSAGIDSRY